MIINESNTSNIKQGDKTTLSYICLTDKDLSGQQATAILKTRQNAVVYTTESSVQEGNVVEFMIDKVLPVNRYIVEIVVNEEYIFPDDNTIYLNVTASSMGAIVDSIETNSLDVVKDYINNILKGIETAFTKTEADELYQPKGEYVSEDDLNAYATKEYVDSLDVTDQLGDYATKQDIAKFITETKMMMYVDGKFFDIERKGYVKKEYVDEQIEKLSQSLKEELASTTEEPAFVPDLTGLLSFNESDRRTTIFSYSDGGSTLLFDLGNVSYHSFYKPKYISKNGKFIDISDKIEIAKPYEGNLRVQFKGLDKSQIDFMTEGITNTYTNPSVAFMTEQRLGVTLYVEK